MAAINLLLVRSAQQVVTVVSNGERVLNGENMKKISVIEKVDDDGVSLVVGNDGKIVFVGLDSELAAKHPNANYDVVIDASGKCVLPGFVDAHTHPVWAGDRVHEFAMKLAGATYMDIHKAGGGIHFTVDHTRKASEEDLYVSLRERIWRFLKCGTTLMECKSGYGLDVETELKMLRVIERAKRELPVEISATFCGAHAIPRGMTSEDATDAIIDSHLPAVSHLMTTGEISVENIDVFCEKGVFDVRQSRRILEAGRKIGLQINFHGDELHPTGSAEMGAELKAEAISHLEEISDNGISAMAASGTVAVVLPTTAFMLRLKPPPVRGMIAKGVAVALGTDFNPNAFCMSMPITMYLACVYFHMSMNEALAAATINAAAALGKSDTHGSLEVGKTGDLVIVNAPRWEHVIYQMAAHDFLIEFVIKKGKVVYSSAVH